MKGRGKPPQDSSKKLKARSKQKMKRKKEERKGEKTQQK